MPTSLPRSQESNRYYNMVTTRVFPAFVEKFKHMRVREVTMQQDGARCHTQKKKDGFEAMTQKLNAAGAKLRPRIKVVTQPAQSPDVNICDLAFFRALACALRKRRRLAVWPRVRRAQHSLIWTSWLLIHMQPSTITHPRPWKRCGHTRQS